MIHVEHPGLPHERQGQSRPQSPLPPGFAGKPLSLGIRRRLAAEDRHAGRSRYDPVYLTGANEDHVTSLDWGHPLAFLQPARACEHEEHVLGLFMDVLGVLKV